MPNPNDSPADTLNTDLMAAMDAGIEGKPLPEPAPAVEPAKVEPAAEPVVEAAKVEKPTEPGKTEPAKAEPIPGTPEALAAEKAKADAEAKKNELSPEDAAYLEALKKGGAKAETTERFESMAREIKTFAPMKAALEAAGVKDIADLPKMIERSKAADDMINMVMETGASAEQYGKTLDYLAVASKAMAGDTKAAKVAFDAAMSEVAAWAQILGVEVPGVHDPLKAHPDLRAAIEAGDIKRDHALELARQRDVSKANQANREQSEQTAAQQKAIEQGKADLNALGAELATDPEFKAKYPYLLPIRDEIVATRPPAQWAAALKTAYARIPAPPAAAAPAPTPAPKLPTPGPMRPGGPRPVLQPTTDDPFEAMELGIAAASNR